MKKIITILLVLGCISVRAQVIENGVLTSWSGATGDIVLPAEVTAIGSAALKANVNITSVSGANVTIVNFQAFYGCTGLTSFNFPLLETIGTSGFYNCSQLQQVTLEKVKSIGTSAFHECSKLSNLNCPDALTIGTDAFRLTNANATLKTALLPAATSVGNNAFRNRSGLHTVDLSSAVTIGEAAFWNTALVSLDLPNAETLVRYAFYNVYTLTDIKMPKIKSIGLGAFHAATSSLSSLHTIDMSAASELTTVTIDQASGIFTIPNKETLTIYVNSVDKVALFPEVRAYTVTVGSPTLSNLDVFENMKLEVSPNPTSDFIRVTIPENLTQKIIRIMDFTGKLVLTQKIVNEVETIDVKNLPKGMYFVQAGGAKAKLLVN